MTLIGPSLGGALFGAAQALPFLADAVSYLAPVVSLLFIATPFQGERIAVRRRLYLDIGEGLTWLWHQPLIRYIAILTGISNLVGNGVFLTAIVIAQGQHASSAMIGLIFAVGGVGGILGSLAATRLRKRFSFGQVISACVWSWAILTPLFAVAPNPLVLGLLMAGTFLSGPVYNVVQMSYRLALILDALQGRVHSVFRLIAFSGQPLGYALAGILLQTVGAVPAVLIFSVPYLFAALAHHLQPACASSGTLSAHADDVSVGPICAARRERRRGMPSRARR